MSLRGGSTSGSRLLKAKVPPLLHNIMVDSPAIFYCLKTEIFMWSGLCTSELYTLIKSWIWINE